MFPPMAAMLPIDAQIGPDASQCMLLVSTVLLPPAAWVRPGGPGCVAVFDSKPGAVHPQHAAEAQPLPCHRRSAPVSPRRHRAGQTHDHGPRIPRACTALEPGTLAPLPNPALLDQGPIFSTAQRSTNQRAARPPLH